MQSLSRVLILSSLTVAGCVDAPTSRESDFSCVGAPSPTSVADPMVASGRVVNEIGGAGLAGAAVEIHVAADDEMLAEAGAGSEARIGEYTASLVTGGVAPTAYRKATAGGFLDSYEYDPSPMTSESLAMYALTAQDADALYYSVGLARDAATGTLLVAVTDCAGWPVRNATVWVPGARRVLYLGDDTNFDPAATTTADNGTALVLDVPVGTVEVRITTDDVTYRAWPIAIRGGAITTSWRRP